MVVAACVPASVLLPPQEEPASNRAAAEKAAVVLILLFITSTLSRKIRITSDISIAFTGKEQYDFSDRKYNFQDIISKLYFSSLSCNPRAEHLYCF